MEHDQPPLRGRGKGRGGRLVPVQVHGEAFLEVLKLDCQGLVARTGIEPVFQP